MGPTFIPSSDKRVLIHLACLQQSHKAIYSASVDDKAMVFCAQDCQEIEAPANWKKQPVCDLRLILSEAQTESQKAIMLLSEPPSKTRLRSGVDPVTVQ